MLIVYLLFIGGGYLLGSVLFSRELPRILKHVDIIACSEDGNPGTSNAVKYAGWPIGLLCLALDLAKGFVPVFFAVRICGVESLFFTAIMAAPVAGHAFSCFFSFRGGKAIATTFGVLLGLLPDYLLVFLLAAVYILFSVVLIIRPNERRTVYTFLVFDATVIFLSFLMRVPMAIIGGTFAISAVVVLKNLDYRKIKSTENDFAEGSVTSAEAPAEQNI